MKIKIETIVKPLPTEELIKKHEKYWRQTLPVSFIKFISVNNGAEVEDGIFVFGKREYMIERFLCLAEDIEESQFGIYDIDVVLSQIEARLTDNENLLGAEVLPIALVFSGDFICLDFRMDKYNPSVCVWSHEESEEFEPVLYTIENSFEAFLSRLN